MKPPPVSALSRTQPLGIKTGGKPVLEIERRFLVKELPENLDSYPSQYIVQGYLSTEEGTSIRLRQQGDKFFQTVKKGTGKVREEIEVEISKAMYDILWNETKGRRIKKTRYEIPIGEHTIQLDIYNGKLTGLVIAEVEFNSIDECDDFKPPEWFGAEITDIKEFTNKRLATNGLDEDLLKKLKRKH